MAGSVSTTPAELGARLAELDPHGMLLVGTALVLGLVLGWVIGHLRQLHVINRLQSELEVEREMNRQRHESMERTFSALSADALQRNNRAFLDLAQQVLGRFHIHARSELELREKAVEDMVRPIGEALAKTEQQLHLLERDRREAHGALIQHLETLAVTQQALHGETRNLVQALRRPEVRGQWGELTLRRLAELAGMVEHCDFVEQVHTQTAAGTLRPDMIVRLPGSREVVVDVKTPLDAYLSAVECTEEPARRRFLADHARNVRDRVRELASKRYWEQFERAPDFVILFIPGDQFLTAALDVQRNLLEEALRQRVVLTTPTSFVALLRAVAYGWRQESLNRNAEQIRVLGEELYARIATLTEHLSGLGRNLEASITQYNRLVGSFEAKVLPGAHKFVELGVGARKQTSATQQIEKAARQVSRPDGVD